MKYNKKYDRYITEDGLVYRYDNNKHKMLLCSVINRKDGYKQVYTFFDGKQHNIYVHRLVYETFIDEIPEGYVIDHINTIRDDNRLSNLRCVTQKQNINNPITIKRMRAVKREYSKSQLSNSDFANKFIKHFGISVTDNKKLYHTEYVWYIRHGRKCRWE